MIVAVMQPYLFPYIGYFQLIAACDLFVLYDDVQYIRGGWINRNRILLGGAPHWLTLPVERAPLATQINDMRYRRTPQEWRRLDALLAQAYRKAPQWPHADALFRDAMACPETSVGGFNDNALRLVCAALGLERRIVRASELERDRSLAGQAAVIDICRRLGATRYLNAIGGVELYQPEPFAAAGIELAFVRPEPPAYQQFGEAFTPNLSILDVLMFCTPAEVSGMLGSCSLLRPERAA